MKIHRSAVMASGASFLKSDAFLRKTLRVAVAFVALAGVTACAGGRDAVEREPEIEPFAAALQERYLQNAAEAYARGNLAAARYYAARSSEIDQGGLPGPASLDAGAQADLGPLAVDEHSMYRETLSDAFVGDMRVIRPERAASAQAAFDCWVRELVSGRDSGAEAACRARLELMLAVLTEPYAPSGGYATAAIPTPPLIDDRAAAEASPNAEAAEASPSVSLAPSAEPVYDEPTLAPANKETTFVAADDARTVDDAATAEATPVPAAAATLDPPPDLQAIAAAARPIEGDFAVFFDDDSDTITPEAADRLQDAIDRILTDDVSTVTLLGPVGVFSRDANGALLDSRSQAVMGYLQSRIGDRLSVGVGPLVDPRVRIDGADSVNAALSRRVEIRLDP